MKVVRSVEVMTTSTSRVKDWPNNREGETGGKMAPRRRIKEGATRSTIPEYQQTPSHLQYQNVQNRAEHLQMVCNCRYFIKSMHVYSLV